MELERNLYVFLKIKNLKDIQILAGCGEAIK